MVWQIEIDDFAKSQLNKLDKAVQRQIAKFVDKLANSTSPQLLAEPLRKELHPFIKYRVGDYRIVCKLENKKLIIIVLFIGHRSSVYDEVKKYLKRKE